MSDSYYVAVDIGAGMGTKIALFRDLHSPETETLLSTKEYGATFQDFASAIIGRIARLVGNDDIRASVKGIGIATAGILGSDGSFKLASNMPQFNNCNLKTILAEHFRVPVGIDNDANAGGLAEWSVLRIELIYWVFGGGWGGAWISRDGEVRFPAHDWDGVDASLHYTNEPGYAIPLKKSDLKKFFSEIGASYELFEQVLLEETGGSDQILCGPGGDPQCLRAEVILSGPGRYRLFKAVAGDDEFHFNFLDLQETMQMADPAAAGQIISKLSSMRVEAAVNTDRLYGKVLAKACSTMLRAAYTDGMPKGLAICLGGKPSYALPYFGPSAQRVLGKMGYLNYMRPSIIDERGGNANLVGAAVIAEKAFLDARG